MMEVSAEVDRSRAPLSRRERARMELYRGQCNCAYWHGVFGGLYLPFLRFETYRHLLAAERQVAAPRLRPAVAVEDYDLDGRPEVCLTTAGAKLYVKPDRGGHAYEWDDLEKCVNLMANFTRREESYHRKLLERVARAKAGSTEIASIHDQVLVKEEGLERRLVYDPHVRESLVDHVFAPGASLEAVASGTAAELGAWPWAACEWERTKRHGVRLAAKAGSGRLEKWILPDGARGFAVRVVLDAGAEAEGATYAMEFNVGLLAGDAPDRYYRSAAGEVLGRLQARLDLADQEGIDLVDEWLGVEFRLRFEPRCGVWVFPIETVSESEGGFERVYQSSAVFVHRPVRGTTEVRIHAEVKHR